MDTVQRVGSKKAGNGSRRQVKGADIKENTSESFVWLAGGREVGQDIEYDAECVSNHEKEAESGASKD